MIWLFIRWFWSDFVMGVIYPRQNRAVCSGPLSTVGLLDCGIFFLAQCPLDCGVGLDYLFMCAHRNTSG